MNLMNAIGGISDRHIEEFAFITPQKRSIKPWMMIASAACVAAVFAVIVIIPNKKINNRTSESDNDSLTYIDHGESLSCYPYVYFNDRIYGYQSRDNKSPYQPEYPDHVSDFDGSLFQPEYPDYISDSDTVTIISDGCHPGYTELPEGYVEVGEITSNDVSNSNVNGYAMGTINGLKIGEKIYQDPDDPEDLYVYTALFFDGDKQYFHFVDNAAYLSLRINSKTFIADFSIDEVFLYELPDGYAEVGEVTSNDRQNKYVDGFGRELYIGDKIYVSQETPDVVYVYTDRFSTPLCYVRYVAYNE